MQQIETERRGRRVIFLRVLGCICLSLLAKTAVRAAADAQLSTEDTWAHIEVRDNRLVLTGLRNRQSDWDWIGGQNGNGNGIEPTAIPFVEEAIVNGARVPLNWRYASSSFLAGVPRRYVFSFVCSTLPLELKSTWRAATGPGPVEHTLSITNRGTQPILLPLQTSLTFSARGPANHHLEHWWVEKGANRPTPYGTHQKLILPAYTEELVSWPYAREGDKARDPIPWSAIQDIDGAQGLYTGVEFSGRVHIGLHTVSGAGGLNLVLDAGLQPEEENAPAYRTRVLPGATFETPTVFVGCYQGDVDAGANRLHRWIESNLRPAVRDGNYPLLVSNTWGFQTAINASLVRSVADDAAILGLDMVHIDAGWYRSVGDWQPDTTKFPDGLAPLADYVHRKGLKLGLWVGWTQGGIARAKSGEPQPLSVGDRRMRDWFTHDYAPQWKPAPYTGADVCLGDPDAAAWSLETLERIIRENQLDLLEHDQRIIVDDCAQTDHLHTASATDTAYQATLGYYRVYDALVARHPALLLEDCVNGGHTVDYGIVRRTHYVSITDTYDPVSNRRAFYDASYALPPSMCECYVDNQPFASVEQFRSMLRSGMMGWCTVMCDTRNWSTEAREAAKRQFAIYKSWLRPLIAAGDIYHISERPDGIHWDGMQYYRADTGRGALFAFRGTGDEEEHVFRCRGLDPQASYRLTFEDKSSVSQTRSGADLMNSGIRVHLGAPQTSELVYLERLSKS